MPPRPSGPAGWRRSWSQLLRRVPPPARMRRHLFSLHEKGVGCERRAVTDGHSVVHEGADTDRAARTDHASIGLEGAVLLRVAHDLAAGVEGAVVADDGEGPLRDVDAVVEDALSDPHAHEAPEPALERGAVESVQHLHRSHLPKALMQPEVRVVDGAARGLQP